MTCSVWLRKGHFSLPQILRAAILGLVSISAASAQNFTTLPFNNVSGGEPAMSGNGQTFTCWNGSNLTNYVYFTSNNQSYSVTGNSSSAFGPISDDGSTVTFFTTVGNSTNTSLYGPSGLVTTLNTFSVEAISNNGNILYGETGYTAGQGFTNSQYDLATNTYTNVNLLALGGLSNNNRDLISTCSADGTIAYGTYDYPDPYGSEWTQAAGAQAISGLSGVYAVNGCSADGSIVAGDTGLVEALYNNNTGITTPLFNSDRRVDGPYVSPNGWYVYGTVEDSSSHFHGMIYNVTNGQTTDLGSGTQLMIGSNSRFIYTDSSGNPNLYQDGVGSVNLITDFTNLGLIPAGYSSLYAMQMTDDGTGILGTAINSSNQVVAWYATLPAAPEALTSVSVSPNSVQGGVGTTGTVTLATAAPAGGYTVNLSSQRFVYVGVPASVTVPAGSTSTTFPVTTNPYLQTYTDLITASAGSVAVNTTLTVVDDSISSVTVNPTAVVGGSSLTGTVNLVAPAPVGGWSVNLYSQNLGYVNVPANLIIPAGATSANFSITTKPYSQTFNNLIKAKDALSAQTASVTVYGDSVASLSLNPTTVTAGNGSTGTVTLSSPAPTGGWTVDLTSQSPNYVGVPSSVFIPAGSSSGTFPITNKGFSSSYTNVIKAADAGSFQKATLNVSSSAIASLSLNPTSVVGGNASVGTITLTSQAPVGGWTVNLSATHNTYVSVQGSVVVPAGQTSVNFNIGTLPYSSTYSSLILAQDVSSHQSATLTITP